MKQYIQLKRSPYGKLEPIDKFTEDFIQETKFNEVITLKIAPKERDALRHKQFFVMIKFAHDHLSNAWGKMSMDTLRASILISAGYFNPVPIQLGDGYQAMSKIPMSISYEKMGEKKFQKLFADCRDAIAKDYIHPELIDIFFSNFV